MPEPFKNPILAGMVNPAAGSLGCVCPDFIAAGFTTLTSAELDAMAMKARARAECPALDATLSGDFASAAQLLMHTVQGCRCDRRPSY
jgi:hypothetical protein